MKSARGRKPKNVLPPQRQGIASLLNQDSNRLAAAAAAVAAVSERTAACSCTPGMIPYTGGLRTVHTA